METGLKPIISRYKNRYFSALVAEIRKIKQIRK